MNHIQAFIERAEHDANAEYLKKFVHNLATGMAEVVLADIERDAPATRPIAEFAAKVLVMSQGERNVYYKAENGRIVQFLKTAFQDAAAEQLDDIAKARNGA